MRIAAHDDVATLTYIEAAAMSRWTKILVSSDEGTTAATIATHEAEVRDSGTIGTGMMVA